MEIPQNWVVILECVSKCREMQFRGHQVAFQGEKPQAYWLQVKVFQPDFASRKSKNPNEIKVKEAEKAK